jgi:hypothetical protein
MGRPSSRGKAPPALHEDDDDGSRAFQEALQVWFPSKRPRARPSAGKILGAVATFVALAGGIVALLFTLEPSLKPCFGETRIGVTAVIFPEQVGGANLASVRYTLTTDGLRGKPLLVRYSLFKVDTSGSATSVVPGQNRVQTDGITPDGCSDQTGYDLPVPIPGPGRYRVLLEVFRNSARTKNRLALTETAPFHA